MKCPLCNGSGEAIITAEAKPTTEIGRILKGGREGKGLTLRQVEKVTGISNPLISQMESGEVQSPSFKNVVKLADVYGIPLSALTHIEGQGAE